MYNVLNRYFKQGFSLGVEQAQYPAYKFTLPVNPNTASRNFKLDEFAQAAIDYLPPYYGDADSRELWNIFIENWGTGYTVQSVNGGLVEMVIGIKSDIFSVNFSTCECDCLHGL